MSTGSEFEDRNFLVRSFLVTLLPILQRHKYYVAWKLGMCVYVDAHILCILMLWLYLND